MPWPDMNKISYGNCWLSKNILLCIDILAQVLALISLIAAATCQTSLRAFITNDIVRNIRSAAGWVIFLSFWVMVYQIIATLQLFLRIKIVYTTVPIIKWSIFFLVVRLRKPRERMNFNYNNYYNYTY